MFISYIIYQFAFGVRGVLTLIYIVCSVKFLHHNIESWHQSGLVTQSLVEKFKWYNAKRIYILNQPDNYRGAYMYRSDVGENTLAETIYLETGKDLRHSTKFILQYNMMSLSDSMKVEKVSDSTLKVTFAR